MLDYTFRPEYSGNKMTFEDVQYALQHIFKGKWLRVLGIKPIDAKEGHVHIRQGWHKQSLNVYLPWDTYDLLQVDQVVEIVDQCFLSLN